MRDVDFLIGLIMLTDTLWALVGLLVILALVVSVIMLAFEPNLERAFSQAHYGKINEVG